MCNSNFISKPVRQPLPPWDRISKLIEQGRTADSLVYFVGETDFVDFPEAQKLLAASIPVEGDWAILAAPNTVLVDRISKGAAELISELVDLGRLRVHTHVPGEVHPYPCHWPELTRKSLLPEAQHLRGYKRPRALWATLRLGKGQSAKVPLASGSGERSRYVQ